MSADANITSARMMLMMRRPQEAEKHARQALAENPQSAEAQVLLAYALSAQQRDGEALDVARTAIGLAPDNAETHYTLATMQMRVRDNAGAMGSVQEAIRINPLNPDYFGLLAALYLARKEWQQVVASADRGIALDPNHAVCANMRALALVEMGRGREATRTVDVALQRNPEDPLSHATQGWAYMNRGDMQQAFKHFRESLRLNPNNEMARKGVMEAMKARNPIYALLLNYTLAMTRLPPNIRFGVIIGGVILFNYLRGVANTNPDIQPILTPLLIAYVAFVLLTWLGYPLFNLLLRFDRFGSMLLDQDDVRGSNWFAGIVIVALGLLIYGLFQAEDVRGLFNVAALLVAMLLLPVSGLFQSTEPGSKTRQNLTRYIVVLVVLLGLGLLGLTAGGVGTLPQGLYFLGVVAFTWILPIMSARKQA